MAVAGTKQMFPFIHPAGLSCCHMHFFTLLLQRGLESMMAVAADIKLE